MLHGIIIIIYSFTQISEHLSTMADIIRSVFSYKRAGSRGRGTECANLIMICCYTYWNRCKAFALADRKKGLCKTPKKRWSLYSAFKSRWRL